MHKVLPVGLFATVTLALGFWLLADHRPRSAYASSIQTECDNKEAINQLDRYSACEKYIEKLGDDADHRLLSHAYYNMANAIGQTVKPSGVDAFYRILTEAESIAIDLSIIHMRKALSIGPIDIAIPIYYIEYFYYLALSKQFSSIVEIMKDVNMRNVLEYSNFFDVFLYYEYRSNLELGHLEDAELVCAEIIQKYPNSGQVDCLREMLEKRAAQ